jgi:signal transduction histidine kinase
VLAHEIRNPLGSIRGTAEILRDDYRPGDPKFEFIEIQIRETERLNRVVEDFLRMARPLPTEMARCPIHDELETVVMLVVNDARKRQVSVHLKPAGAEVIVQADGEKLRQAFLNIAINALQATATGGSLTIVTSVCRREDGSTICEIRFCDTGCGISSASQAKVFDPFYTTKPDGTGLGLAISRKIIEGHGGTLQIKSTVGQGTTMLITLPMLEAVT